MTQKQKDIILMVVTAVGISGVFLLLRPVTQPQGYHNFADTRTFFGIPRALDVLSNMGFLLAGAIGLNAVLVNRPSLTFAHDEERWPYLFFFYGVALTCFGSGYYHLAPNDARLVWDRLPMTLGFMGLMAAILCERVSLQWGLRLLPMLLGVGILSVGYWLRTGDLRLYGLVQFFPALLIPLVVGIYPARYTGTRELGIAGALYIAAKLLEAGDRQIYGFTRHTVSGHTLKHLVAAASAFWILRMLQVRQNIPHGGTEAELPPVAASNV